MPLPDLDAVCAKVSFTPQQFCITFPGGAQQCVSLPQLHPSELDVAKQLIAQANAALAPYAPIFNLIDALVAVFDCIKALPDALKPPPDGPNPAAIAACVPHLREKINKLLALLPQFVIPLMILGILDAIILSLSGLKREIESIVAAQVRALNAATRAGELGNIKLQQVVDCKLLSLDVQFKNLNEGVAPLNSFMATLKLFGDLASLPGIPAIPDLGEDAEAALSPLQEAIDGLRAVRDTVQDIVNSVGSPPTV
jgi:hypothetical protein